MILVYAYVCGDILHTGHLAALKNAKALGDKLIVGVLTDEAVMERKPRPAIPFAERLALVGALSFVDCVVAQDTYSPFRNVVGIHPDILMESSSHPDQPANSFVRGYGGRVISMPYFPEQSSSVIKARIREQMLKGAR